MGEAKRRKLLDPTFGKVYIDRLNDPNPRADVRRWTYIINDEVINNKTLDEALNLADFYTKEQAEKILSKPAFLPDVCRMQINDKVYGRVKQICLQREWLDVGNRGFICWERTTT